MERFIVGVMVGFFVGYFFTIVAMTEPIEVELQKKTDKARSINE